MPPTCSYLTLEEVAAAKLELNCSVYRNVWRVALRVLVWGAIMASAFLATIWLYSFIEPIKSVRVYWAVGVVSFIFFGSWPLIDFLCDFSFHRGVLASFESRIRAGENVPRPNKRFKSFASLSGTG